MKSTTKWKIAKKLATLAAYAVIVAVSVKFDQQDDDDQDGLVAIAGGSGLFKQLAVATLVASLTVVGGIAAMATVPGAALAAFALAFVVLTAGFILFAVRNVAGWMQSRISDDETEESDDDDEPVTFYEKDADEQADDDREVAADGGPEADSDDSDDDE